MKKVIMFLICVLFANVLYAHPDDKNWLVILMKKSNSRSDNVEIVKVKGEQYKGSNADLISRRKKLPSILWTVKGEGEMSKRIAMIYRACLCMLIVPEEIRQRLDISVNKDYYPYTPPPLGVRNEFDITIYFNKKVQPTGEVRFVIKRELAESISDAQLRSMYKELMNVQYDKAWKVPSKKFRDKRYKRNLFYIPMSVNQQLSAAKIHRLGRADITFFRNSFMNGN